MAFENLQPLTNSRYISTYAGLPLEQIQNTGNVLQQRYYQNLANQNAIELALEQQPYLENDKTIQDSLRDDLQKAIKQIAADGGNYENATQKINSLSRAYLGDKRRLAAEKNYKTIEEEIQRENEMRAKGITPLTRNDRQNFSTVDPETGQLSNYTSDLQAQLNYNKAQEELFDDLKASVGSLHLKELTGDEKKALAGYLKTGQWQGISNSRITNYLNHAMNRYKDTPEYAQQKYFGLSDQDIKSQLLSTGLEQVFSQSKEDLIRDLQYVNPGSTNDKFLLDYETQGSIKMKEILPDPNDFDSEPPKSVEEEVKDRLNRNPFNQSEEEIRKRVLERRENPNILGQVNNFMKGLFAPSPEVQAEYDLINKQLKDETSYEDYYKTFGEDLNKEQKYVTGEFRREGKKGDPNYRARIDEDTNKYYHSRLFYDLETKEIIDGGDADFYEDYLDEGKIKIEALGDYDLKNNWPSITGNNKFGVGRAVKIGNKEFIMTTSAGSFDPSADEGKDKQIDMLINQTYDIASRKPNIFIPMTLNGASIEIQQVMTDDKGKIFKTKGYDPKDNNTYSPYEVLGYRIKYGDNQVIQGPSIEQVIKYFIGTYGE